MLGAPDLTILLWIKWAVLGVPILFAATIVLLAGFAGAAAGADDFKRRQLNAATSGAITGWVVLAGVVWIGWRVVKDLADKDLADIFIVILVATVVGALPAYLTAYCLSTTRRTSPR
jgi:hypothetical protein